jgi:hypothetical protein
MLAGSECIDVRNQVTKNPSLEKSRIESELQVSSSSMQASSDPVAHASENVQLESRDAPELLQVRPCAS